MSNGDRVEFGVAILAAGASSRMGRPKLLLPWFDTTILGHLVREWKSLGVDQIAVVVAPGNELLAAELTRLELPEDRWILNSRPEQGMFSSIRSAAAWTGWRPTLRHVVFTLGDQPQVSRETLHGLLQFAAAHPGRICQPERNGRGRHPVMIPRLLLPELAGATESNLKEFLLPRQARVARWPSDDAGLDWDIDEPGDYERARRLTGQA